jgi:hypothetical protein
MIMQVETKLRAHDFVAEISRGARQFACFFHALISIEDFAMHIVVAGLHTHGVSQRSQRFAYGTVTLFGLPFQAILLRINFVTL